MLSIGHPCAELNPSRGLWFRAVLSVYAAHINADDPLSGLMVGELDPPAAPSGWISVDVRAASLNHHDLWSLRGVGLPADRLPMILGCDAAGVDADGNEVVVHSVVTDDAWRGDETLDPRRSILSERYAGTFAERVWVPRRNLVPEARRAVVRRGRVPADGVADRLPDAVHARRGGPGLDVARAGRGRRRGDGADRAGAGGGAAGVGDLALGGEARAGAVARRRRGLRAGRAAARAGRRRGRDRGRGDLGSLPEVAEAGRDAGDLGRDLGRRPAGRPEPGVLPAALRDRLDDGHPRRARPARPALRRARRAAGDRVRRCRWRTRARRSRRSPAATSSASSFSRAEARGRRRDIPRLLAPPGPTGWQRRWSGGACSSCQHLGPLCKSEPPCGS